MTPYAVMELRQHWSGNGLLPDGIKPLPEPMFIYHQTDSVSYTWRQFHRKCWRAASLSSLTHWGQVMHICVIKLTIIGSDNGLSPGQRHAIIWTNDVIFVNWILGSKLQWNLNRNLYIFIDENVVWKMVAILPRPQCVKLSHPTGVSELSASGWVLHVITMSTKYAISYYLN